MLVLLALASWRFWRLVALDAITDGIRRKVTGLGDWTEVDVIPWEYREGLADFISCPWCLGFWLSIGWWLSWLIFPHVTLVAAVPFAVSALVGTLAHFTSD